MYIPELITFSNQEGYIANIRTELTIINIIQLSVQIALAKRII